MKIPNSVNSIINPYDVNKPVLKGVALGAITAYAAGITISSWLHRSTHGGVEYSDPVKKFWRGANFLLTGMPKIDWVDHLAHHEFPDRYDESAHIEWNASKPEYYHEAPKEAFRDPYSPILEGYLHVLFNTSGLHRKAKQKIVPFLRNLDEQDKLNGVESRDHWPKHFRRVDMEEGDPNALRNKKPYLGLVALGGGLTAIYGPLVAGTAMSVHLGAELLMGGDINSINHTGQAKGFKNRLKVILGIDKPIPDENGFYAANLLEGHEAIVAGEQHHQYHHENPQDPYLAGDSLKRDPPGFIIKQLVRLGLAHTPGSKK